MSKADWIAVDWGTSNLRIWVMDLKGAVIKRITSDQGMGNLTRDQFEPVLVSHLEPWLGDGKLPVIACGMLGSRQGWVEAPYVSVPAKPALKIVDIPTQDDRLDIKVIAGLMQQAPADVMRGEETQIAGYLAKNPTYCGVLCLPGTHSKWAVINAGEVISFQTVLTGELFDILATQSILRHSMGGWSDPHFLQTAKAAIAAPEALLIDLFKVRASQLLRADETGKSQLSGMVIGTELGALKSMWQGQDLVIIGAGGLADLYGAALSQEDVNVSVQEGGEMTLSGLTAVFEREFL